MASNVNMVTGESRLLLIRLSIEEVDLPQELFKTVLLYLKNKSGKSFTLRPIPHETEDPNAYVFFISPVITEVPGEFKAYFIAQDKGNHMAVVRGKSNQSFHLVVAEDRSFDLKEIALELNK